MAFFSNKYFWWFNQLKRVVWDPFWWVILTLIVFWVPFLRVWWWVFVPLFLAVELEVLYLWWIKWDYNYSKGKWVTLEIVPPKEVLTPLKAMEDVFSVTWGPLYNPANWREVWCEGAYSPWMSWEIASIEGSLHFYLRVLTEHRLAAETILYSHYPELEIHEVQDYTKSVPQNIPNQEWDVYGEDFVLGRSPAYPIKTYEKFFEPQGEKISAEEKRIDPTASLLEMMSKLGPGENYWIQVSTAALFDTDEPQWKKEAEKIIAKISKRPIKKEKTLLEEMTEVAYNLIVGPHKEGVGEKAKYKWLERAKSEEGEREMVITPGEREIITEIENKMKKTAFLTTVRGVYVAKRENWRPSHRVIARPYFSHFQTHNLNYLVFSKDTRPKTHYVFRRRIPFLRTRRMFRNFVLRFPPFFPNLIRDCAVLSAEELATLFHFPLKVTGLVLPTMPRVESKRGGPPPNLPTE